MSSIKITDSYIKIFLKKNNNVYGVLIKIAQHGQHLMYLLLSKLRSMMDKIKKKKQKPKDRDSFNTKINSSMDQKKSRKAE